MYRNYPIREPKRFVIKAMAANYYGSPVLRELEDHLFISGRVPTSW